MVHSVYYRNKYSKLNTINNHNLDFCNKIIAVIVLTISAIIAISFIIFTLRK